MCDLMVIDLSTSNRGLFLDTEAMAAKYTWDDWCLFRKTLKFTVSRMTKYATLETSDVNCSQQQINLLVDFQ